MSKFPHPKGFVFALAVAALAATACGGQRSESAAARKVGPLPTATASPLAAPEPTNDSEGRAAGSAGIAPAAPSVPALQFGTPIGTATDVPSAERDVALPVGFRYPALGIELAPIDPVGVEPNGEMEIPGADDVGWYEFGPSPGDTGSAVLAAHIAYNGVDGVFRDLVDSHVDDVFTVVFDDGSESDYLVVERAQYDKTALPFDRVFARSGAPMVTLVSCGGDFQRSLSSYQDNIVAYAVPVEAQGDATP
jgi:hypothetical protein